MRLVTTLKTAAFLVGLLVSPACLGSDFDAVDGPNVRVMRHDDNSRTIFLRSPDNRTLTKKNFTADGTLNMMTIYTMDAHGNPLGSKIMDGQNRELYKASYGYRKADGRLEEERLFDSRVKRMDPHTGQEMPVRRFIYTYDAHGNRSAPISITLTPGRTAEDVYGSDARPSALESNPFDEDNRRRPVNPNARPLGR